MKMIKNILTSLASIATIATLLVQPAFAAVNTPSSFTDCQNNGYQNFTDTNGHPFRNEGVCIAYVARHLGRTEGSVGYTANSLHRHAQWSIANDGDASLSAIGAFAYTDANYDWYVIDARDLKVSGQQAWFAGPVTDASQSSWIGQWLFGKIDSSTHQVWGSFTDQTTAESGVMNMSDPSDGPFTITSGHFSVH